jgi:hypothetical protein
MRICRVRDTANGIISIEPRRGNVDDEYDWASEMDTN